MARNARMIGFGIGAGLLTGIAAKVAYEKFVNGTPALITASTGATMLRAAIGNSAARAASIVSPELHARGVRANAAQIQEWCRKVGRTQGATGINEVDRIRTSVYINPAFPLDLHETARLFGEGTGTGIAGGTILCVLYSWETGAGRSANAACWNYNFGNEKLYGAQWHADQTPPCYFLVDNAVVSRNPLRIGSLDFYPSFTNVADGVRAWMTTTFGNARYTRFGSMQALRDGNIRAFCRAIGQGGYATSYKDPRAMDARAMLLAGMGRYSRNRAVIDGSLLHFDDSIPARHGIGY